MLVGCVLRHWPDLLDPNARSSQCKTSCVNFVADYVLRLADIQSDEKKIKLSQTARDPPTSEDGDSQLQASQKDNKRQDTMGLGTDDGFFFSHHDFEMDTKPNFRTDRRADKTTEVRSEMLGLDGWEENSLTKVKQTKESSPNKKKLLLKYHSHSTMLKSLMRYKMKADTLRHVTESKQRMLGALCVQRRSLASDLATLMELVRTSRNHLDNQREVNRNLLLKIEQLCGPSCARYKDKGTEIAEDQFAHMAKQMEIFKTNLEDFAAKHKDDIRKDPQFRLQFQEMCASIGVDPLASSKGFWSEMLGVGDFYYELGVQIVEVCLASSHRNGGLISIDELRDRVVASRGRNSQDISIDDLLRAIKKLRILGNGFTVLTVGNTLLVQSVPGELTMDHTNILQLAQKSGYVSKSQVMKDLKWEEERSHRALVKLSDIL
ncbi:hypothetical protein C0Q70_10139 [Pomacea canaliculata]|uniref:Vacuolar-sorting protein SNF8 n=1 Tax=Pomacea canaliculata TaxID=400727 RepID=A0A2T7PBR5_POMCA|nr:hypothetical protein C0Q70_10139 [Pomacea canaliculata]